MINPITIMIVLIVVLFAILLASRAKLEFSYKFEGTDDYSLIVISILGGLIKYRHRLPSKTKKTAKEKEKEAEEEKTKLQGIFDKMENLKEVYRIVQLVKSYLNKKIRLKWIEMETEIGTGDACQTGVLSGAAWAAAGILLSYIANAFHTEKKTILVRPNFNEKKFMARVYCIFTIQVVHIIVVSCKLLYHQYFKKEKLKGGDINV